MFDSDILLAFAFMGLLFVRQIVIIKHPNKINSFNDRDWLYRYTCSLYHSS